MILQYFELLHLKGENQIVINQFHYNNLNIKKKKKKKKKILI